MIPHHVIIRPAEKKELNVQPLVSAIIPVWNGAHFLGDAVASIRAQSYAALEILVMDDGSTDETPQVAARLGDAIRYLPFPHRGQVAARLAGVQAAQGEILGFLDVDDLWAPDKTARQIKLLQENPDMMVVNGYTQLQRLVSGDEQPMRFQDWGAPLLAHSYGSALFRREVLHRVPFQSMYERAGDLDWFLRAADQNVPILKHTDVVLYYRRHTNNLSNDQEMSKRALLRLLHETIARRNPPPA